MIGIVAFGSYIPRYRLSREVIAAQWGLPSLGGERAVAGYDEDSLTLAVNAALNGMSERDTSSIDGVFFASTTSPYEEKQAAATVAAVLDAKPGARTLDFANTLRAATSAVITAVDVIAAGHCRAVLVCAGEARMGEPDSMQEQTYGDAGAALWLGTTGVAAEILECCSFTDEFLGSWRTGDSPFVKSFPGAFETKFGYSRWVFETVTHILKKSGLSAKEITKAIIPAPNPKALAGTAKALGFDPKTQLQDTFWERLGDSGTAQPLVMLSAALEQSKPSDLLLLVGYGDGADAMILKVTDEIVRAKPRCTTACGIENKRWLSSYGKYARFRRLIRKEYLPDDESSPVVLYRDRKEILPLYGGRCPKCGVVQFPIGSVCVDCGNKAPLAPIKLARTGRVFTFTHDYLFPASDSPVTHTVVDLDGGGRVYVQLTDGEPDNVEIGMLVELVFRKYHDGSGIRNYFWKARPTRF